jgi:catechol 2,3-dioxygenase-like lactoylglutathione lyase family enzyme
MTAARRAQPRRSRPAAPRLFRVILPVANLSRSIRYYSRLLGIRGNRVSPGRCYFRCGDVILALYHPAADGDPQPIRPLPEHIYFAVDNLAAFFARARKLGRLDSAIGDGGLPLGSIAVRPWGERSFYMFDPSGNPLCFVDRSTLFNAA